MRTFFLALISLILFNGLCYCQTDSTSFEIRPRLKISILGGIGIPTGEFSKFEQFPPYDVSTNFNIAGEAKTGYSGKFDISYLFGKHFGIATNFSFSTFETQEKTKLETFGEEYYDPNVTEEYQADSWKTSTLLIGGFYEFKINKITLGLKLMGGTQKAISPEVNLKTRDTTQFTFINHQPQFESNAFAYSVGTYASFPLSKVFAINLSADYVTASHLFDEKNLVDISLFPSGFVYIAEFPMKFEKQISAVSIMTGITYCFNTKSEYKSEYKPDTTSNHTEKPGHENSRFNISFNAGVSIPVGDFSSLTQIPLDDPYSNYNLAGSASIGFGGKIDLSYLLGKHFGITGSFYSSLFGVPETAVHEIFESSYFRSDSGTVNEMGHWNVYGLLAGVQYQFSKNNFQGGFKAMAGYQWAKSPGAELEVESYEGNVGFSPYVTKYDLKLAPMYSSEFAYSFGGFARFALGEKTQLNFSADYISAYHRFSGTELEIRTYDTSFGYYDDSKEPVSFNQSITFVNVMVGITFLLD